MSIFKTAISLGWARKPRVADPRVPCHPRLPSTQRPLWRRSPVCQIRTLFHMVNPDWMRQVRAVPLVNRDVQSSPTQAITGSRQADLRQ